MSLSDELGVFIDRWWRRAQDKQPKDLFDHFDKFFTLFIIYNRLYAEVTFWLWDSGQLKPRESGSFPDKEAATQNVARFIEAENLMSKVESDSKAKEAVEKLIQLLKVEKLFFKLNTLRIEPPKDAGGKWLKDADDKLRNRLESGSAEEKANALLEVIYCVRCNTFHGSKTLHDVQIEVLESVTTILELLIDLLRRKLEEVPKTELPTPGVTPISGRSERAGV